MIQKKHLLIALGTFLLCSSTTFATCTTGSTDRTNGTIRCEKEPCDWSAQCEHKYCEFSLSGRKDSAGNIYKGACVSLRGLPNIKECIDSDSLDEVHKCSGKVCSGHA